MCGAVVGTTSPGGSWRPCRGWSPAGGVAETLPGIVGATPVAAAVVDYWDVTGTNTEVTVVSVTALGSVCQALPDVTLTSAGARRKASRPWPSLSIDVTIRRYRGQQEVTDECITAFAQQCRVLSDVIWTNAEVTDESAAALAQGVSCCPTSP